ncbi:MAG: hypothetical protein AAF149_19895 [Bacteroidota bacterium]
MNKKRNKLVPRAKYSPGKYDTMKIYALGRINLHPDFYSLIFTKSNMEYSYTFIYNFSVTGLVNSSMLLTVKDNLSPTYMAS